MKKRVVTNIVSRGFGKFASHKFHPVIQKYINRAYVRLLHLDMSEFRSPESYESLNALFTRKLEKKRNLQEGVISPTDSLITECGRLNGDKALQIKGMSYSVSELLQECDESKIVDGQYINLYLSPRDYHRYHMPYDLQVKRVVHVPGKLYPVNLRYLRKKIDLFIENERVVLECYTKSGIQMFIVLVGALNVGKMTLVFEKRVETNKPKEIQIFEYEDLWLKKGELLGYFKMGSTVLLFFQRERSELLIQSGEYVRFGQQIAKLKEK
ncbi:MULTISPECIES: phosphatidylserine decarboxylase [unclassified Nitratiruptor]|uniref:phosphatidylserine decarboxylase n=1 Tax=unclassified Nitratiruptor TaxID=2624044 RepID=UPI001915282C|nr:MULTISPECIES: phosphatidylserine decarboxylase [unclassified Nitratiruptor]BCD60478.1 phosphatidylserine decarboxylase [Nitratiruptor sp. YY08-10]